MQAILHQSFRSKSRRQMTWQTRGSNASSDALHAAVITDFHDALHYGDVQIVRKMLFHEPKLANARDANHSHETSLMVATTCKNPKLAILFINLLMAKGAVLATKDDRRWHVLMYACSYGVAPIVIDCLLDWNQKRGGKVWSWSDTDKHHQTALLLACTAKHGRLASYLLKVMPEDELIGENHPLQALYCALQTKTERCAMDLLRNQTVRLMIKGEYYMEKRHRNYGEWSQTQQAQKRLPAQSQHQQPFEQSTVSTCVQAAIEYQMVRALQSMYRINRDKVGRATWLTLYLQLTHKNLKLRIYSSSILPEFQEIVNRYKRDTIWSRMKLVFLIRYKSSYPTKEEKKDEQRCCSLRDTPDQLFRVIVEFLKPAFNDAEEAQKESFKTLGVA